MSEIDIRILPNGKILISRSIDKEVNSKLLQLLQEIVTDPQDLEQFLKAGDVVEAEVEGVGLLRNRVVGPDR